MIKVSKINKKCLSILLTSFMLAQAPLVCNAQIHYINIEGSEQLFLGEDDKFDDLTNEEKRMAEDLIGKVLRHENDFMLTGDKEKDTKLIKIIYRSVYRSLIYFAKYNEDGSIHFCYEFDSEARNREEIQKTHDYIDNIINKVIKEDMNDLDKVMSLYLYLANNYSYNRGYIKDYSINVEGKDLLAYLSVNDIKDDNKIVCHTYTYMIEYACQKLGINFYPICGTWEDTSHMWGQVEINNQFYHLDPTFEGTKGDCFKFFLQSDKEREKDKLKNFYNYNLDNIRCNDNSFDFLRDVKDAEYLGNNVWKLKYSKKNVKYFNTNTLELNNDLNSLNK